MSPQEYTRIVQLYADDLYRLIFSYCHNASDAEDLLQNVFEKLLRNKKPFQNDDHAKACSALYGKIESTSLRNRRN